MNKQIIGILVCTLLMSTFLTASGNINVKQMTNGPGVTMFDDDVPVWEVGYSWTYTGGLHVEEEGILFDITFNEGYFGVIDDSGSSYNIIFGGDIGGELALSDPSVGVILDTVSGNIIVAKSTLGFSQLTLSMTGMVTMQGIPFPVPGTIEITITYDLDLISIEFPLAVGNSWVIPQTNITMHVEIIVLGVPQIFDTDGTAGGTSATCLSQEDVVCGTNTYTAYNITSGEMWKFYAPSAGNFVKMLPTDNTVDFILEMIAMSYPTPDSPLKPDTPSGPTSGGIGQTYDYTTKAVDPNGDQIKYGWDWNSDMIPDEWTGEYNSDVSVTTSHSWPDKGTYEIRVKARNGYGLESVWSDPLPVSMPRNKLINRPFLQFLQDHPNIFPILQRLSQRLGV